MRPAIISDAQLPRGSHVAMTFADLDREELLRVA